MVRYGCLEKRDADKTRQEQTGVTGAGRGLKKRRRPRIRSMRIMRRPTTDNHAGCSAAPCPAQSMAAKMAVMGMIIKKRSLSRLAQWYLVESRYVVADGEGKD
jgi:hypothetical protein